MPDLNTVVITGNLTRDPELRQAGTTNVCRLRVAVNERVRNSATGEWGDRPNYFDVTVWGGQGENCHRHLSKGRGVAVDGRLRWREFETEGQKRQAIEIVARDVKFLGGGNGTSGADSAQGADNPVDEPDFLPSGVSDDDIPF